MEVHEDAVESAVKIKRSEANGDIGFDFDSLWGDDEPNQSQITSRSARSGRSATSSRSSARCSGSTSPTTRWPASSCSSRSCASTSIAELLASDTVQDGDTVVIAGLVTSVQHRVAKASGNQYGMIQVEDFGGEMTVMFMGKAYQEFSPLLQGDSIVVVRGRVSMRDDGMNLHAFSLMIPDLGQADDVGTLMITMPDQRATTDTVSSLAEVLSRHPGESEVRLRLVKGQVARVFEVPKPVKVSPDLYGELKGLLGPNCLV